MWAGLGSGVRQETRGCGEAAAGVRAWTRSGSGSRKRGGSGMSLRFWPELLEELICTNQLVAVVPGSD